MYKFKFPLACFVGLLLIASCNGDRTEMEKISRHRADSLFNAMKPALEQQLDSVCQYKISHALQTQLDSLVEARKAEIIKLQQGL